MKDHTWLDWAIELQSLAQTGLTYCENGYDRERYTRLREIAAEMAAAGSGAPLERVRDLFCGDTGYPTPKLDTRAAIFQGDKILLVREANGRWSLPGGWCEVNLSVAENAVKEVREEAGLEAQVRRIIAVQDRDKHNRPRYACGVCKVFLLCTASGGAFVPNLETTASGYFAEDALPELAEEKNTAEQIRLCFAANRSPQGETVFD